VVSSGCSVEFSSFELKTVNCYFVARSMWMSRMRSTSNGDGECSMRLKTISLTWTSSTNDVRTVENALSARSTVTLAFGGCVVIRAATRGLARRPRGQAVNGVAAMEIRGACNDVQEEG
jgi:hypothetical protein